jgi:hypothetical protein
LDGLLFRLILEKSYEAVQAQLSASRVAAFSGQPWNRFKSLASLVSVAFAAVYVCGVVASARVETGQIAGTLMDQTGAAMPNAAVAIKIDQTLNGLLKDLSL